MLAAAMKMGWFASAAVVLASLVSAHAAKADPNDSRSMAFVEDTNVGEKPKVEKGGPLLWPGELMIGVGILGVGTSIGLFTASNAADEAATAKGTVNGKAGTLQCNPKAPSPACLDVQKSVDKHNAYGNAAIGTVIVGGAALAGGVIYMVAMLSAKKPEDEKKAALLPSVVPLLTSDFEGIVIGGRF